MKYTMSGEVIRKWAKGNFARVTIKPEGGHEKAQLNFRSFGKDGHVQTIDRLVAGQRIQVEFEIESECIKDKSGTEVKVDGYNKWVEVLTARKVTVDASSKSAEPQPPIDDDQIPF